MMHEVLCVPNLTCCLLSMQKKIVVKERPYCKKSLDSSDVFILDLGLEIYQVGGLMGNPGWANGELWVG